IPLKCKEWNMTRTCTANYTTKQTHDRHLYHHKPGSECPSYFRWIHEDLRPWKETGITKDMVERARRPAHFRLVILDGKVYLQKFRPAFQTRDVFTLWGILQLLRWYPGKLPDLELMFNCNDRPLIRSMDFPHPKSGPPLLFGYCTDRRTLDIVFPDWSFWGWVETNIKPWRYALKDIEASNKRTTWLDRKPYAYWRGNPFVAKTRKDLLKCNVSQKYDWNARVYIQNWGQESRQGYEHSHLEDQCTHRYKIYIEGWAWSVSEKYILACNSMTLLIRPWYVDFFTRGLVPLRHYWPIRDYAKCTSLKFAVEWGNNHTEKAKAIGEAGSRFIYEDLKMEHVYDYMYHLLNEYGKLFRYKPTVPRGAVELCSEAMACPASGTYKRFMLDSMVRSPSRAPPCSLPPPFDPPSLGALVESKANLTRQVEKWEDEYW
ncbi:CAP10 domain-containing protein, partial [Psidium guajava]